MPKQKAKDIATTAFKAASGYYGGSWYRQYNNASGAGNAEFNVGKWWENRWHSDCLGFVHIMVNGFCGDKTKLGGGAVMDNFVWNSDEATTLNSYCSVKGKFPHLNAKPSTLLQSSGHVGLYIGDGYRNGINTAECTTAKGGGWVLTWTDLNTGARYSEKGGYYISSWENWGEFDRVDYTDKIDFPKLPFSAKVLIDDLNIRKGAGTDFGIKGLAPKGNLIIDKVQNNFGYVDKLGGWIYLANPEYTKIGEHIEVSPFKDVKVTDPAYYYIKKMYDNGLMNGYANGKFCPNKKVTRRQIAIVLGKLLDKLDKK